MKKIFLLITLILFTSCSTRLIKPSMHLTLMDKQTNYPLFDATSSENIKSLGGGILNIPAVTKKTIPAPSGIYFIDSVIAIAPTGYKPQWCICKKLNYDKEGCTARNVKFTPQTQNLKNFSVEELNSWLKIEKKNIYSRAKQIHSTSSNVHIFCSEDTINVKKINKDTL